MRYFIKIYGNFEIFFRETGRSDESVKNNFQMSIESGSFLWSSMKGYCDAGGDNIGGMCSKAICDKSNSENKPTTTNEDLKSTKYTFLTLNKYFISYFRERILKSKKTSVNIVQQAPVNRKRAQVQVSFEVGLYILRLLIYKMNLFIYL